MAGRQHSSNAGDRWRAARAAKTSQLETDAADVVFAAIDVNADGRIDRMELKSGLQQLAARLGADFIEEREEELFFAHAMMSAAEWKRATNEWMVRKVAAFVREFLDEGQHSSVEYATSCRLASALEERYHLGLDAAVVPVAIGRITRAELSAALCTACKERIEAILEGILRESFGESCGNLSIDDVSVVDALLQERHGFQLSADIQRTCMRMYGTISIEHWKSVVHELLGGYTSGLPAMVFAKDPELRATLKSGIPLNQPFDFRAWERAQGQNRWWQSVAILLRQRSLIWRIRLPLLLCISVSVALDLYNNVFRYLLNLPTLTLPSELFSLTASPLGLLLVFRTNGAYGRYDEARKIWGDTLNRCRDLARQASWMGDASRRAAVGRFLSAFGVLLKCHLRGPERHDVVAEVGQYLSPVEVQEMQAVRVPPPLWALNRVAWMVDADTLPPMKHMQMSQNISELIANVGKCERLLGTPMPLSYSRLSTRFLFMWLLLLPFYLYRSFGASAILAEAFIAFFLLELEDIGHHIEEPFSVLPLDKIADKITTQVAEVEAMWKIG